jgi:hypothetical protein
MHAPEDSVADWFTAARRWADILLIAWRLVAGHGDGEYDGSA